MAMFVKKEKSKLQEFLRLYAEARAARTTLLSAQERVTQHHEQYILDNNIDLDPACINRFDGVVAKSLSYGTLDENVVVKLCDSFNSHHLCENNNCPYEELNWDLVAAHFAYDAARQKCCDLVRSFFRIQRKGR